MQNVRIPVQVDPVKCAVKRAQYDGVVPAQTLKRFQELLLEPSQDPIVEIGFGTDPQGLMFFSGKASVEASVKCERCGEPLAVAIEAQFAYAPVTQKQTAEDFPEAYEAIEPNEFGEIALHGLIEDELILAMPLVPKHEPSECSVDRDAMTWGEIDEEAEAKSENPFAVLQELTRK
ncbi:23S rRNA accumulation protein YceD [Idiomarina tyrosinivorans]|uniref:Large ribosomal RNA subunit accumulation protein YceD n=1 Tax=Idiomarina tyrosinivorans TaxID=1445662 RepID=A0A432ZTX0_9GAMM|nr:23S rRNA accumulation protein YceD [Idiomarina tyrosinivorans]RUO81360.1 23S rRNA accumulation protein YceD [Idiomarina tyrosinivorans]